jgi:aspartate/methionine/tyrosine aminotransferase
MDPPAPRRTTRHPDLIVVSDEAYRDLCLSATHRSPAAQADDLADRIVSIFSFSKTYAMASWRVGYVHAERSLAGRIAQAHGVATMSTPTIGQHAARAALTAPTAYVDGVHVELARARDVALHCWAERGFDVDAPEAGFFLWVDCEGSGAARSWCGS